MLAKEKSIAGMRARSTCTVPVVNEETFMAECGVAQSLASRNFDFIKQNVLRGVVVLFPQPVDLVYHRKIQVGKC